MPEKSEIIPDLDSRSFERRVFETMLLRLGVLPGSDRRQECLRIGDPLFTELCKRLMDRRVLVQDTADWGRAAISDCPSRSAIFRFQRLLRREYLEALQDVHGRRQVVYLPRKPERSRKHSKAVKDAAAK